MKRYDLVTAPFNSLLESFFSDALPSYRPALNSSLNSTFVNAERWAQFRVKEKEDGAFAVEAELAGVKKEDLKIEVIGDTLKISGTRGSKEAKDGFCEYGEFTRSFTLGSEIDTDHIEAKFENGYLLLHIPRAQNKKTKYIDVK